MNKKWQFYEDKEDVVKEMVKKHQINPLLAKILVNREILEEDKVRLFLNPTRNDFHDPFLMPDMKIAVDRLLKAINKQEKVMIYGDYDVDGITSITVLKSFLEERGIQARCIYSKSIRRRLWIEQDSIRKNS